MIESPAAAVRPLYLDTDDRAVFGTFHSPPPGSAGRSAVLICPAWGWDEITTYRSRRAWAEALSAEGHPTLRIDLPGSGDSAGAPTDPDQVAAWQRAIHDASRWLEDLPGVERVTAIGLGLGGSMAALAAADGAAIDDLVLWSAPVRGRTFLREQRAFAALQSSRLGSADEHGPGLLPAGWLEVGGFVLTSETMSRLEEFDLLGIPRGRLARVLLLGRDGLPADDALRQHLVDAGIDVTVGAGDGWEAMCFHPERYQPPVAVFERVSAWLAAAPGGESTSAVTKGPSTEHPEVADTARLSTGDVPIRETTIGSRGELGGSFGIVAEPEGSVLTDTCLVFLNAGAIRRIGPNRMWVEAARRWAARGVRSVRIDVAGIGDADGEAGMYADVSRFYTPDREGQVKAILDELEAGRRGSRFVLIGLCAGAYSAFNAAAIDDRVIGVVGFNPKLLVWDPDLLHRRNALLVTRVLAPASWRRILRGETSPSRILEIARIATTRAANAVIQSARRRDRAGAEPWIRRVEELLDRTTRSHTSVTLAFSGDEPLLDELRAAGVLARPDRWPELIVRDLPERDHTLRPIQAQRAGHEVLDEALAPVLGIEPATRRGLIGPESPEGAMSPSL